MCREPHRGWRAQPDESIAVTGACVAPVALVCDVVGVEAEGHAALLAAGRVTRAQAEKVVAGHADSIVHGSGGFSNNQLLSYKP